MHFSELELETPLLRAVKDAGYEEPSPIQEMAIPPVLMGRDLLGCAQTGTGKTAAFALPMLQVLSHKGGGPGRRPVRALVLTPTRELALQILESFETYGKYLQLRSAVIFGGVGQAPQVQQLRRGVDILVATPGRLNDLIGQGHVHLANLEIFVLDEADRMLDMGFVHDVQKVIKLLPKKRQNLLFSATMPPEIVKLANTILQRPAKVFVTPPATTVEKIDQSIYKIDRANKRHLLAKLLREPAVHSALVFTRTKHGADRVVRELKREEIPALAIHGNKSQTARQKALGDFKSGKVKALVATDIAARGLDINELSHVVNYDLPNIPDTYVHRIGRTGRAGQEGIAISFCSCEELPFLADIEKLIGFHIPEVENHPWPMMVMEPPKVETSTVAGKARKAVAAGVKDIKKAVAGIDKSVAVNQVKNVKTMNNAVDKSEKVNKKPASAEKAQNKPAQRRGVAQNPYENRSGGQAIITKRPVWADADKGPEPAKAPSGSKQGEEAMSRNNRRRRGKPRSNQPGQEPEVKEVKKGVPQDVPAVQARQPEKKVDIPKGKNGIFDFSEEELAEDQSLRLISGSERNGEAKYASFEDYLKDH